MYNVVAQALLQRKFVSKLPLLLEKDCLDVKRWRTLFPESNDVWRSMNFPSRNKILFQLAQSPLYWLVPLLRRMKG